MFLALFGSSEKSRLKPRFYPLKHLMMEKPKNCELRSSRFFSAQVEPGKRSFDRVATLSMLGEGYRCRQEELSTSGQLHGLAAAGAYLFFLCKKGDVSWVRILYGFLGLFGCFRKLFFLNEQFLLVGVPFPVICFVPLALVR